MRPLVRPLLWLVAFNVLPAIWLRPPWATLVAFGLVGYRGWIERSGFGMPPRILRWGGQIAVISAVWWWYRSFFGDEAAGTLLTLLVGLKVYELRTPRDLFLTYILCLLVLMSYLLLDQSLTLTLFMVADLLLLTSYLFALGQGRVEWSGLSRSLGPSLGAAFKAMPLVVLTFVLFPRFSTGFGNSEEARGKIGVTDSLRPGSVSSLVGSNELVFRAKFLTGVVPPRSSLYWRGAVLSQSDGLDWDRPKMFVRRAGLPALGDPSVEVYLEPTADRFLYALDEAPALVFPNEANQRNVSVRDGDTFELTQALRGRDRYYLYPTSATNDPKGEDPARFVTMRTKPSERMAAFLKSHRHQTTSATVHDLLASFRKDFSYTLSPPRAKTVDDFVFGTKAGFCEHFAAALGAMLRWSNIPARVVVGFQGGTSSLLDNYISVRGQDAHAWVEYYNDAAGRWLRADPTAQVDPQRINEGAAAFFGRARAPGWLDGEVMARFFRTRALFDEIDASWTGFLLRFDLARQQELLARVGMEGVLFRALPVFLILGIALVTAVLYFLESRRRTPLTPAEKLYRRLLARAKRRFKTKKAPTETALAYLARLERLHPEAAPALRPAFELTIELMFKAGPAPFGHLARARAAIDSIR